jgi:thiol-disulfide isomerase/thioredoxin
MGKGQRIKQQQRSSGTSPAAASGPRAGHVSGTRGIPWFYVALGLIAVAFLAVLFLGNDKSGSSEASFANAAYSAVEIENDEVLAPFSDSLNDSPGDDSAIGETAPIVNGETPTGKPITIGAPSDKPTVLVFLAHWCPHCQREVPVLVKWMKDKGMPTDFNIVGVATASSSAKPNYPPATWLDDEGWKPSTLMDDKDGTVASAYGIGSYPYFVLLGKDGTVVQRASGEKTVKQWEELIAKIRTKSK